MKKPTPDELAQLRAAYPKGTPRLDYREMRLTVGRDVVDGAQEEADENTQVTTCADCGAAVAPDETECPKCGADMARAKPTKKGKRAPAGEDGLIPISISSEQPVLRYDWWDDEMYYEVLDHAPRSVDLAYAEDGLPFVASHRSYDADQQHGIVENIRVEKKRLVGDVRMSSAQRSQEIGADMRAGIRKKVSVGYIVGDDFTQEKGGADGIPVRRYTSWMPLEVSTVPVPADYTVGVGRALSAPGQEALQRFLQLHPGAGARSASNHEARKAEERTMPDNGTAPGGAPDIKVIEREANERAATRVKNITDLAVQHGCQDKLDGWLRTGASEDVVVREINGVLAERLKKPVETSRGVELSEKEFKRFSYARALLLDPDLARDGGASIDTGFEREIVEEARKRTPMASGKGIFIPFVTVQGRANIDSGTSTTGGAFKITQPGDFIDLLRNKTSVMRAGARVIPGLTGPVTFPKQTGSATGTWVAENPGSDMSRSNLVTSTVSLAFKTVQAATAVSRQALFSAASGNYDLEAIIRGDMAKVLGLAVDLGGLNGLGSSNQPLGILQDTNVGTAPALGTNGGTMAWGNWVDLETAVGDANADDVGSLCYITNTKQRGNAKKAAVLANTASGVPIWTGTPGQMDGVVNGYRAIASNQVPRNLTKGTATTICSGVVFGAFDNLMIGMFGAGFEVLVDPYTLKLQNLIDLTAWTFVDVANRYPVAFATIKDAL